MLEWLVFITPKKKKLVPRKFFLFNNLILIAKKNESSNVMKKKNAKEYALVFSVYIKNLICSDMSNIADVKFGFELKSKVDEKLTSSAGATSNGSILIACESLIEKREWLKDIKALIKDHQMAEVKRRNLELGIKQEPSIRPITRSSSVSIVNKRSSSQRPVMDPTRSLTRKNFTKSKTNYPEPPPDDNKIDWKQQQEEIDLLPIEPLNFSQPCRWGNWLEYQSNDFGIPFYYHTQTKVTTWIRPLGWTLDVSQTTGKK